MPKKKKTREQKIMAVERRNKVTSIEEMSYSLPTNMKNTPSKTKTAGEEKPVIKNDHYQYLTHDLRKTLLVTVVIIVLQFVVHSFIK